MRAGGAGLRRSVRAQHVAATGKHRRVGTAGSAEEGQRRRKGELKRENKVGKDRKSKETKPTKARKRTK